MKQIPCYFITITPIKINLLYLFIQLFADLSLECCVCVWMFSTWSDNANVRTDTSNAHGIQIESLANHFIWRFVFHSMRWMLNIISINHLQTKIWLSLPKECKRVQLSLFFFATIRRCTGIGSQAKLNFKREFSLNQSNNKWLFFFLPIKYSIYHSVGTKFSILFIKVTNTLDENDVDYMLFLFGYWHDRFNRSMQNDLCLQPTSEFIKQKDDDTTIIKIQTQPQLCTASQPISILFLFFSFLFLLFYLGCR